MDDGVFARVVEVESVRERGVGQDGIRGGDTCRIADERALLRPAEVARDSEHRATEIVVDGGERVAERVEHEIDRRADDRLRNGVELQADDEAGEAPGAGHAPTANRVPVRSETSPRRRRGPGP